MRHLWLAIPLALLFLSSEAILGQGFNVDEQWRGGNLTWERDANGCVWFAVVDARWNFLKGPNGVPSDAVYSQAHHERLALDPGLKCYQKPFRITLRTWRIGMESPESNRTKVEAKFDRCQGDSCQAFTSKNHDFDTVLFLRAGRLIDTDESDPDGGLFWPSSYQEDLEGSVQLATNHAVTAIDEKGGHLRDIPISKFVDKETAMKTLVSVPTDLARYGGVSNRTLVEVHCVPKLKLFRDSKWADYVAEVCYVQNSCMTRQGSKLLEEFAWSRENGAWSLLALFYLGGSVNPK